VAYYGYDEANETDNAMDLSGNGRDLTVNNSPQAQIGRVANARLFNGTTTYSNPSSSVPFRISGELTLLVWVRLDGINTGGSFLRCILACDGTTGTQANNTQYALFIDNNGALIYRHEYSTGLVVQFTSANSILKTGTFHQIGIIRKDSGGGTCTVSLIFDNAQTAWSSCTVNGSGQSPTAAVPYPDGGSTATFKTGKSDKASDGAFWYGSMDELTIHNIARSYKPYCVASYYAVALSPLLSKITGHGNVSNVSTAEVGGGTRWWTYERDQDIYIIREAPLGLFWPEVRLTSGPGSTPAGATKPSLVYDSVNDILSIFFIISGHIFKITAAASDTPSTQVAPGLADTGSTVKMYDAVTPANNPAFGASVAAYGGQTSFDITQKTGGDASMVIGQNKITSSTGNFASSDAGRLLIISSGANAGRYYVSSYTSPTSITVTTDLGVTVSWPATLSNQSYVMSPYTLVNRFPIKIRWYSDATQTAPLGGATVTDQVSGLYSGTVPSTTFVAPSTVGVRMPTASNITGYQVYARYGGAEIYLGNATLMTTTGSVGWFYSLPTPRVDGVAFYAIPLDKFGQPDRSRMTNIVVDHLGYPITISDTLIAAGRNGDNVCQAYVGAGESVYYVPTYSVVNRYPIKMKIDGGSDTTAGGGGTLSAVATISGTGRSGLTVTVYTS
jgi:hypothetical protein